MPDSKIKHRKEADNTVYVRDAVLDFLASADVKRLTPGTQTEYKKNLLEFAEWCGSYSLVQDRQNSIWSVVPVRAHRDPILLHKVNAQVVHLFLEHVGETHTPSRNGSEKLSDHTYTQYVKDIKRFLNWCLLDDMYSEHVLAITVQRIKKPKVEETIIEVFTEADIEALFDACHKEVSEHLEMRDTAIVSLLLDTGIRASELCGLTIGNTTLDVKDPHIKILGKGKHWGEVGFGEQTRRVMQKYLRQFREPTIEHKIAAQLRKLPARQAQQTKRQAMADERFFVNRSGNPLTRGGLQQIIERLCGWAEIEGVRGCPHDFRHYFAKRFMEQGGNIYQLSKILRHSSVRVTEEYLKALRQSEARKGAMSILDNLHKGR
jgi:integrase/recombinase XerD